MKCAGGGCGETARSLMAGIDEVNETPVLRFWFRGLDDTEDRTDPLEYEDTDSRVAS